MKERTFLTLRLFTRSYGSFTILFTILRALLALLGKDPPGIHEGKNRTDKRIALAIFEELTRRYLQNGRLSMGFKPCTPRDRTDVIVNEASLMYSSVLDSIS